METFIEFLQNNFINCVWLIVLIIAICPALEGKIALPLAMNAAIWGNNALSPIFAFTIVFFSNIVLSFILLNISRKLKNKTSGFIVDKLFLKYKISGERINRKENDLKKYLALTCFIAVPLPLSGVWSGSIIAGFTNLKLKYCFISIVIGSFLSSVIMALLCTCLTNSTMNILLISISLIIVFLVAEFLINCIKELLTRKKKSLN